MIGNKTSMVHRLISPSLNERAQLEDEVERLTAENERLRQQLSAPAPAEHVAGDKGAAWLWEHPKMKSKVDFAQPSPSHVQVGWTASALYLHPSAPGERLGVIEALRLVVEYDDLLRSHEGPSDTLFAGDVEAIDAAYDTMVVACRAALAMEGSKNG